MKSAVLSLVTILSAAPVFPQSYQSWPIVDGNVSWGATYPTSPIATSGGGNLLSAAGLDHLYQSWWFYRLDNDSREYTFNNAGGQIADSINVDGAGLHWSNVDSRGIEARLCIAVFSTGPTSGMATQTMTITNNTGAPVLLNLFSYADLDVCGSTSNSAYALPNLNEHEVFGPCGARCYFVGCNHDHYEAGVYPNLRDRLTDSRADNLSDYGLPLSGDYTAAFQWQDRLLQPGDSFSAQVVLGVDFDPPSCFEATEESYGTAKPGSYGLPSFHSEPPVMGTTSRLTIDAGYPGSVPILLFGSGQANLPLPPFGTLEVLNPFASTVLPAFDGNQSAWMDFALPIDPSLTGAGLTMQAVWMDPNAVAQIAHTTGLAWLLGATACRHPRIQIKAGTTQTYSIGFLNRATGATSENPTKCTAAPSASRPDMIEITAVAGAHGPTHINYTYVDSAGVAHTGCIHVRVVP